MRTPLYELHKKLGARFTDFHGWEMPLQYSGIVDEVLAVRTSCGLFDISHMGRIILEGEKALSTLQRLTTNNLDKLTPGKVQYNLLTNERGGVKDDITVYMLSDSKLMLCVNAGSKEKVVRWLERFIAVRDISPQTLQIALQGRESLQVLSHFFDLSGLRYYHFRAFGETIISRTGYTGEDGFEIYAPLEEGLKLFKSLSKEVKLCGLGARDVLRIEAGYPLYGHELSENITPFEAGLERFVDLSKDFIGKEAMLSKEIKRKLFGLEMVDRGIPREGYKLYDRGTDIGLVSSGTYSPTLERGIALCFVDTNMREEGREVTIEIRNRRLRAKLREHRFLKGSRG